MSLRVHCDNCEKYMYETAPGIAWTHWAPRSMGDWLFCSDECLKAWAQSIVDSPAAEPRPRQWAQQVIDDVARVG